MLQKCEFSITKNSVIGPLIRFASVVAITSLLTGCGLLQKFGILSTPEPREKLAPAPVALSQQPYELQLRLSASSELNPDTQSRPSPVQVRVFITETQSEIADTGFEEMFDYSGNVMEPRPLAIVTLQPGQTKDLVVAAYKSQSILVVAAAYRDPFQSGWKALTSLKLQDTVSASAIIGETAIIIDQGS